MNFRFAAILVAATLSGSVAADDGQSAASSAAVQPGPDLLGGIVPYVPGRERGRFLQSAGVDNELQESELVSGQAFARVFDKWAAIRQFDANSNGAIDWFEADSYRKALRDALIAQYDVDKSGKLDAKERDEANRDLAAGKVPPLNRDRSATPARPGAPASPAPGNTNPFFNFGQPAQPGQLPPQLMQMLDTDGDGQLSKDERVAGIRSFRDRGWQWALSQYDKDGDGKVSDDERAAAPPPVRFIMKLDDLGLRDFDEDGDGQLSDAEYGALDDYFQKWMKISEQNTLKMADTDGDGQLSPAEQAALGTKMQAVMFQMLPRAMNWADSNGDGQASPEEWMGLFENFSNGFDRQIDRYTQQFDANGDGRLNAAERDALIAGSQEEEAARYRRHDKDGDGQLNVAEMLAAFEEAAEEWGVKPGADK